MLTNKCNLRCKHCFANGGESNLELSTDKWHHIMQTLSNIGVRKVSLLGGEPTLRKDFFDLLDFSLGLFKQVSIQTNGQSIDKGLIDQLASFDKAVVHVSIEDYSREFNDYIRGKGTYDKALKFLIDLDNPKWVRTTIFKQNDPLRTAMLAEELGASWAGVRFIDEGRGKFLSSIAPDKKKMTDTYLQIREFNNAPKYNDLTALVYDSPYYLFNEDLYSRYKKTFKKRGTVCPAGYKLTVSHTGKISPCQMMMDRPFADAVTSDDYTILRGIQDFLNEVNSLPLAPECESCPFKDLCNGGCKYYALKQGYRGDPVCPLRGLK